MFLRSHKHPYSAALCVLLVIANIGVTFAAEPSEEDLVQARDQFEEVWHSAAEASKRQAELQGDIDQYETKAKKAKADLESVTAARRELRIHIAEQEKLIVTLSGQIAEVALAKQRYSELAARQRANMIAEVRMIAIGHMVTDETGPVAGGVFVRRLLKGSAHQNVSPQTTIAVLVQARLQLIAKLEEMSQSTVSVQQRLLTVQKDLDRELQLLELKNKKLGTSIDQHAAAIDFSWKALTLSQQELKQVQDDTAEVSQQVMEMQKSLVKINSELKEHKLSELRTQLAAVTGDYEALLSKRQALIAKDAALQIVEDGALQAWKAANDLRNSDKKQYKRVEEATLELDLKRQRHAEITAILDGSAPKPDFVDSTVVPPDPEKLKIEDTVIVARIAHLAERLTFIEQGLPADLVDEYLRKRSAADKAKIERAVIAAELKAITPQITAGTAKASEIAVAMESVNRESGLEGLPPLFAWPVIGPITAGYHDSDYKVIFGVPHQAVDIATRQGTSVHPVAEGVVFAVKLGGSTGYTYVLIGHRNGYASLYGHLSQVYVKPGDIVDYTTIIGLSGGTPGTSGAGRMTTGAHLHVEIMKDGEYINPLSVLTVR